MKKEESDLLNSFTDILTTNIADVPFNSIGNYHYSVFSELPSLWKFFSPQELTNNELDLIFTKYDKEGVLRHAWNTPGAYPKSKPLDDPPSFVLH